MISDTLSDAVHEIREYLDHPATAQCYEGEMRNEILDLLARMNATRERLDGFLIVPAEHVAVPVSEIESLRDALPRPPEYPRQWAFNDPLPNAISAIIARLPRKVDHVAEIERMLSGPIPEKLTKAQEAALEAAIARMREEKP